MSEQQKIAELRKKLVVAEADFVAERLENLIERLRNYCALDEKGNVHVLERQLPRGKQVGLCLIARFLGSKVDEKFSPTLTADEIATFLGTGKPEVIARAKELVDAGFGARVGKGQYKVNPVRIEGFLDGLDSKNR
jgi:hypothetical protein